MEHFINGLIVLGYGTGIFFLILYIKNVFNDNDNDGGLI